MILPTINHYNGNQTRIKAETGVWLIAYNAENRPIRWQSGDTVITMAFDRMGRRVEMRTVKDGEEALQRFVYDAYLCIQQLRGTENALFQSYVWDPTEPIATRPLVFLPTSGEKAYYFHDGNKNVSNLMDIQGGIVHYDYAPFGLPTSSASSENPFCFSSEFYDSSLGLSYYNYRHYNPCDTRWIGLDYIQGFNGYLFCKNTPLTLFDWLGLLSLREAVVQEMDERGIVPPWLKSIRDHLSDQDYEDLAFEYYREKYGDQAVFDAWLNQESKSTAWQDSLPECPKCINIDTLEAPSSEWERPHTRDDMYDPDTYHPEAAYEMRTARPNEFGAGNQCIYDENGCLISSGVSAGTTDRKQAASSIGEAVKDFFDRSGHIANDVRPYDWAYRLDGNMHGRNVMEYLRRRSPK